MERGHVRQLGKLGRRGAPRLRPTAGLCSTPIPTPFINPVYLAGARYEGMDGEIARVNRDCPPGWAGQPPTWLTSLAF